MFIKPQELVSLGFLEPKSPIVYDDLVYFEQKVKLKDEKVHLYLIVKLTL